MTRQARRLAGSAPSAAISRAFSTELGVSIIAHSRVFAGAPMEPSTLATVTMSPGCATFGTRIASGATLAAARRSSMPQAVSMALGRITSSRRPYPPALTAAHTPARAAALPSGATESSRSRISESAGIVRALSRARSFKPGM